MCTLGLLKHTLFHADKKKLIQNALQTYASASWDPYLVEDIDALKIVQKRAVRFISELKGIVSISDKTHKLGLDTLECRRKKLRMSTMLKLLENRSLHPILVDFLKIGNAIPVTRGNIKGHPKAQRINRDQLLNSLMPRTMKDFKLGSD